MSTFRALCTAAFFIASAPVPASETWIELPHAENRQTLLTPTAWAVTSGYTGGRYIDVTGSVQTAEVTLTNSALLRLGTPAAQWDVMWTITNEGTGDFTRFVAMAGGLPHFLHDLLSPGEIQIERATVSGPIMLAQWSGQWGTGLGAGGNAVYFLAMPVPEFDTGALLALALCAMGSRHFKGRIALS